MVKRAWEKLEYSTVWIKPVTTGVIETASTCGGGDGKFVGIEILRQQQSCVPEYRVWNVGMPPLCRSDRVMVSASRPFQHEWLCENGDGRKGPELGVGDRNSRSKNWVMADAPGLDVHEREGITAAVGEAGPRGKVVQVSRAP